MSKPLKPYPVEFQFTMIVMAEDEVHAADVASSEKNNGWHDTSEPEMYVFGEVKKVSSLAAYGWDGECIPYGGDGYAPLKDLIHEA